MLSNFRLERKAKQIAKAIQNSKNPIMFFDSDTDGATSYLQIKKTFPHVKGFSMPKNFEKQHEMVQYMANNDTLIVFDVPILKEEFLEKLPKSVKKIIWVDHHPSNDSKIIKKYKILHLNPLLYNKYDNRPATYLAYLVCSKPQENLFLVTMGSIADFFLLDVIIKFHNEKESEFKTLIKLSEKRKTELFDFIEKNNFNSEKVRTQREEWIRFLTYDAGVKIFKNFFDCVFKLKEYEDVQRAFKKLEKLSPLELKVEILAGKTFPFKEYEQMKKDYSKILEKALKQKDEPLFIFESKGKVAYTKTLSEELTYKLKKWKVVAIAFNKLTTDSYRLSLRGNGVRVNDLVQKSLEGLDGYGGGHPYAAGGTIKKKDFDKFIQNLKSNFSRLQ